MEVLIVTLAILVALALPLCIWLLRERYRFQAERDVAAARSSGQDSLRTDFQALASEVLRTSNDAFLKLAKESFTAESATTMAAMEERKAALERMVKPLQKAVEETHHHLRRAEKDQAGMREHMLRMNKSNRALRAETSKLVQALRKPNVRGRYGEIQLQRVVELAGMRSYCDFTPQAAIRDASGRLQKPDLVVRLPNGRVVAVDAKMPFDAYMDAIDAETAEVREECLDHYAQNVQDQVKRLSSKEYWANFEDSPELVVMFMPGDQLIDAALERRPDLIEQAAEVNVVFASPSTLIGLLRAVHVGWRERTLTENAEELFRLGRELHRRTAIVLERAAKLGDSLESARKNYNAFVGSVESRMIPALRKFEDKEARSTREVRPPRVVEEETRKLNPAGLFDDVMIPVEPIEPADPKKPAPRLGEAR
jgi:DNA recombination protein RmuC